MNGKEIFSSVAPLLELVEREIGLEAELIVDSWQRNGHQAEHISRLVHHLLHKPGKMLRPALVLLSAELAGSTEAPRGANEVLVDSLVKLATAVEIIHSASLIHDDIIDDEQLRRGQAALHRRFGNHAAVLMGDVLYAQAFSLISAIRPPQWERHLAIYQLFCDTTRDMCLGEIIEQRALQGDLALSYPEYLHVLSKKTAVLMSACCESAALLVGADEAQVVRLREFGLSFGLAFQLLDDQADRDALVPQGADIAAAALEHMARACDILNGLRECRASMELRRACQLLARPAARA